MTELLFLISIPVIIALIFMQSFKHCSSSQILVISNKNKLSPQRKIVPPSGFGFVNPLSQKYAYIELFEAYPLSFRITFLKKMNMPKLMNVLSDCAKGNNIMEFLQKILPV